MFRHFAEVRLLVTVAMIATLTACASGPHSTDSAASELSVDGAATAPVDPPEAVAAFERAMQQLSSGDLAGAERAFVQVSEQYPTYAGPLINLAILQAKAGRHEEAERSLIEALARNPQSAPAHNQLGILYRKLGRFREASEAYERAVQSDPSYALAHLNLGVLCDLYLGQPERALQSFERYLEIESEPEPQVQTWIRELRSRLGVKAPTVEAPPAKVAPVEDGADA